MTDQDAANDVKKGGVLSSRSRRYDGVCSKALGFRSFALIEQRRLWHLVCAWNLECARLSTHSQLRAPVLSDGLAIRATKSQPRGL